MTTIIQAQHVAKQYGAFNALNDINFNIQAGQIVGLIGPNGAGKTTLLRSILGLTEYQGNLSVLGLEPRSQRVKLMEQMCFIADVAILPRWLKVQQAIDFVAGVHPRFDRVKAAELLDKSDIPRNKKIKALSKGMITQLHLALVMAIDAKILVLDEPTLGLDIIYRKTFYDRLLNDYFNEERTIVITTHQVEEIEGILTNVMMLNKGRVLLDCSMDEFNEQFVVVLAKPDKVAELEKMNPLAKHKQLGQVSFLFATDKREEFQQYGEITSPSVADVFVAKVAEDVA